MKNLVVITLLILVFTKFVAAADETTLTEKLYKQQLAFSDAKSLNDDAVAFILAGKIYEIGQNIYSDNPKSLAPIVLAYAEAAATYQEPVALELFKEALALFNLAYDQGDEIHIAPLILAADEASVRNEPEIAYEWYKLTQNLLASHRPNGSFLQARQDMGLAYLFRREGQIETSEAWALKSMALLEEYRVEGSAFDAAGILFQFAEVKRALNANAVAVGAYEKALSIYLTSDKKERWTARRIGTTYRRLIEVNYKMGDYHTACRSVADRFKFQRGGGKIIAFDPLGQFSPGPGKHKAGEIAFRFSIGSDCRAFDLQILKTIGVTKEQAYSAIANLFLTPGRLKPGKHVSAEGALTDIWPIFLQD